MVLWDFHVRGRNVILQWAQDVRLGKKDRGLLDQKIDALEALTFDLACHTHLIGGPLNNSKDKHIYKLRVNASVMVRIIMCRGPNAMETECTFLAGATERDMKLDPPNVLTVASQRRQLVCVNHEEHRKKHERFT